MSSYSNSSYSAPFEGETMTDNASNDVQDPAEQYKVDVEVETSKVGEEPEPPTETTTETVTETPDERVTETVTETPAES